MATCPENPAGSLHRTFAIGRRHRINQTDMNFLGARFNPSVQLIRHSREIPSIFRIPRHHWGFCGSLASC